MDNRLIFLYYDKSLNMKPVGDEAGVKRPAELRGDGEPERVEVIEPMLSRKASRETYCNRTANRHR